MRVQDPASQTDTDAVYYPLTDHLGSTSLTANYDGASPVTQLYKPWGEVRYQSGTLPTDYTYTGQYAHTGDFGLMFYVARWYDPALGRFAQADTVVPQYYNPQDYDRYWYVRNNPLRYTDPTGHFSEDEMCEYWGYCGDGASDRFKADYGKRLWGIMWGTGISFGDLLIYNEGDSISMFVLFENADGTFSGGLWSVTGGTRVNLSDLTEEEKIAGYHYDPETDTSFVQGMDTIEFYSWFGGEDPKFNYSVDDLSVLDVDQGQMAFYTYVDLDPAYWANAAVFGLGILIPGAQIISVLSVGFGLLGYASDGFRFGIMNGPVDATYPVVMYVDPAHGRPGRSSHNYHFSAPQGGW